MGFGFFTESHTYKLGANATGTGVGGNLAPNAIDYNRDTYWESAAAEPHLTIDLITAETIDSVWFYSENVSQWRLSHSDDNVVFTLAVSPQAVVDPAYNFRGAFTAATKRYWRLDVTQEVTPANNTKIYEVFLMSQHLDLGESDDLPADWRLTLGEINAGGYRLNSGNLAAYNGVSNRPKAQLDIDFEGHSDAVRSAIRSAWESQRRTAWTVFPEPIRYPADCFQMICASDFNLSYSYQSVLSGSRWNMVFEER